APLLLVALGVAGYFVGREEAQLAVVSRVAAWLGDGAAFGLEAFLDAARTDGAITPALVGLVAMVVGAFAIHAQLRSGLDRIWKSPPRVAPPWRDLLGSAGAYVLVAATALLVLASLLAGTFVAAARPPARDGSVIALHAMEFFLSFGVLTALFAIMYRVLPTPRVEWRDVWLGAAAAALLFWPGKLAM